MARDFNAWARVMRALLPPGKLFDSIETPDAAGQGSLLWRLLRGMAKEFARVDSRIDDLLAEVNPFTATELLPEWETSWGLPDELVPVLPSTVEQRRAVLAAKVVRRGKQNLAAYQALVATCGWELVEARRFFKDSFFVDDEGLFPMLPHAGCVDSEGGFPGVDGLLVSDEFMCTIDFRVRNVNPLGLSIDDLTNILRATLQLHFAMFVTVVL